MAGDLPGKSVWEDRGARGGLGWASDTDQANRVGRWYSPYLKPASNGLDSEIRDLGDRNAIIEEQEISLGANLLAELSLCASVAPLALPGLAVGVGIVDSHQHFQGVPIVDHPPALDDMVVAYLRFRAAAAARH